MKRIITKISRAVQVVLLAPIKLPGKALHVLKYIAVGLGIIETVLDKDDKSEIPPQIHGKEDGDETVK